MGELELPVGKQRDFILEEPARINLLYGSVRSTKTWSVNIKILKDILTLPTGNILFVGNTGTSLYRNVLTPIKDLVGEKNFELRAGKKECEIFGRTVWIEGADNTSSYKKIEGESLLRAYVDEGTTIPENFTNMLLSRLSDKGACLYLTCNPETPRNYIYRNWIARQDELNIKVWKFTLDDNPYLPLEYKRDLEKEYPKGTVFYDRFILGNWVAAEGRVFGLFARGMHCEVPPATLRPKELRIGADYGTHNACAFVALEKYLVPGRAKPTWYVAREYYWDSVVEHAQKTDADYSKDMAKFASEQWGYSSGQPGITYGDNTSKMYASTIEVDPSAASFILQLQRDGLHKARAADNDVLGGIRKIASMIGNGDLIINSEKCPVRVSEMETYAWDQSAADRGEDKPQKIDDHVVDALRYAVNSIRV